MIKLRPIHNYRIHFATMVQMRNVIFFMWTIVLSLTLQEECQLYTRCCRETTRGFYCEKSFFYIILYNRQGIAYKSTNCDWCQVFESTCKNFVRSTVRRTISRNGKFFFNNNNVRLDGCAGSNDKHDIRLCIIYSLCHFQNVRNN